MSMYGNYYGNFNCDRQSKFDYTASTINFLLIAMGSKLKTVEFYEYDKDGNLVEFNSDKVDDKSRTDIVIIINKSSRVNAELKERWQPKYNHLTYGKEGDKEGWMLNIDKAEELLKKEGLPLYVNLFQDGWIRSWDLSKIPDFKDTTMTKNIAKTTVIKSEKISQSRYQVWNKDCKLYERIKGYPSDGKWRNEGVI